jgi:Putative prokaryotic signal transducing protein
MNEHWVKVYTTTNVIESQIVLSKLRDNGIDAVEMNKRDSSIQAFGNIEILVKKDDEDDALNLINEKN